jgi:anti-sigma regulatory factor (Ser/Thr protein kinase)
VTSSHSPSRRYTLYKEIAVDRLTVSGTLDALESVGQYVVRAANAAGLETKAAYRLRLAVDEVATNVVVHGYDETGRTGSIEVWWEMDDQELRVIMEDTAPPFDPHQARSPQGLDLPLDERPIGGLGVFLALRGVDELRYEQIGDRNRNTFIMHRPAVAPT